MLEGRKLDAAVAERSGYRYVYWDEGHQPIGLPFDAGYHKHNMCAVPEYHSDLNAVFRDVVPKILEIAGRMDIPLEYKVVPCVEIYGEIAGEHSSLATAICQAFLEMDK